jgi:hypothetical protein
LFQRLGRAYPANIATLQHRREEEPFTTRNRKALANRFSQAWIQRTAMNGTTIAAAAIVMAASAGIAISEPAKEQHGPNLIDFMMTIQNHHAKLWYAGNARNWELADYQVDELKETLEDAGKLIPDYKGVPVRSMVDNLAMPPIEDIEGAIKAKDHTKFVAAYDKLTAACNSCHEGSKRGFIVIQRPADAAFPNQSFAPRKR